MKINRLILIFVFLLNNFMFDVYAENLNNGSESIVQDRKQANNKSDDKEVQEASQEQLTKGWFGEYNKSEELSKPCYQTDSFSATRLRAALLLMKVNGKYATSQEGLDKGLIESAKRGDYEKVRILLSGGAEPQRGLAYAIACGSLESAKHLVAAGAKVKVDEHLISLKECYSNNAVNGIQACNQVSLFMQEIFEDEKTKVQNKVDEEENIKSTNESDRVNYEADYYHNMVLLNKKHKKKIKELEDKKKASEDRIDAYSKEIGVIEKNKEKIIDIDRQAEIRIKNLFKSSNN